MAIHNKLSSTCAAAACVLVGAVGFIVASGEATPDVTAVDGLRIRLQVLGAEESKRSPDQCLAIFENVTDSNLNLNLGSSLANGQSYHPTALRLLAFSKGKSRTFIYSIRVAGRVDPFIVPLPAKSTYSVRISLNRFSDSETGEPIDFTNKDLRITAELVGEPVIKTNPDLQGLALMSYWQGKIRSNDIQMSITNRGTAK
jgi:hypothetical protein